MTYFLFSLYLVLFSWLITKVKFIQKAGLPNYWLIGLFILKVTTGVVYGWYCTTIPNYVLTADTWRFFFDSKSDTILLFNDPVSYFTSMFDNPYEKDYRHLFSSANSYWNDLKHTYMVKIVSLFNVFSGTRYYVNVIFYSFITFLGPIAFIRVMNDVFPDRKKIITLGTFLLPSFLFYSSGIHKDGFVFMLLTLAVFYFYFGFKEGTISFKKIILVFLLLALIFPVRNHVVLAAIPAFVAWWLAEKLFKQKWIAFLLVTALVTTAFFTTKYINPKYDLPVSIVLKQKDFLKLGGNSILPQRKLETNFLSFLKNAPQALNHTLARPYLIEIASPLYLLSALEIAVLWLITFIWFFRFTENPYKHSVVLFFLMTSMALLLLTGYIVPQLGAIVRYRSIYLPLLVVPILATSKWNLNILK